MVGIGAVPAFADSIYDFSYNGSYFQATGTLDVNGSGLAVSGSGTLTYDSVTTAITLFPLNAAMLADTSSDSVRTAGGTDLIGLDNQVYPGVNPLVDGLGLIFWMGSTTPTGALASTASNPNFCDGVASPCTVGGFAIYSNGPGSYSAFGADIPLDGLYNGDNGSFTLTYVPDGGTTLVLLGLAVAGLAGLRRKLKA
jgi:hypothetical protein